MKRAMTTKEKGRMIANICIKLQFMASNERKAFDYGDTFLSLALKTDSELLNIARFCKI